MTLRDSLLEKYTYTNDEIKNGSVEIHESSNWVFFNFAACPMKHYILSYFKRYLEKHHNHKSYRMVLLYEGDIFKPLQLKDYFIQVGYSLVSLQSCLWYHLEPKRVMRFHPDSLFIIIDCVGSYAKHIYFWTQGPSISTSVHETSIQQSIIIRKLIAMAANEYMKCFNINVNSNEQLLVDLQRVCTETYHNIKNGAEKSPILLTVNKQPYRILVKKSTITCIEQQLVLNHIRSQLGLQKERLKELSVVLTGKGLYYDTCCEVLSTNMVAERVVRVQPAPTPSFKKLAEPSAFKTLSIKFNKGKMHRFRCSLVTFDDPMYTSTLYEKPVLSRVFQTTVREKEKKVEVEISHQNLSPFAVKLVADKKTYRSWKANSLLSVPDDKYPLKEQLENERINYIQLYYSYKPMIHCGRSLCTNECWHSHLINNQPYLTHYSNQQLDYQEYSLSTSTHATHYLGEDIYTYVDQAILQHENTWIQDLYKNNDSYIRLYKHFHAIRYSGKEIALMMDESGNMDVITKDRVPIQLGYKPALSYPEQCPSEAELAALHTVEEPDVKEDNLRNGEEESLKESSEEPFEEPFEAWKDLDGDLIESSWVHTVHHLFHSNQCVSRDQVQQSLDMLITSAKSIVPKRFLSSYPDEAVLFETPEVVKEERTSCTFNLTLSKSDTLSSLNGYTVQMEGTNEGKLFTSKGELVYQGEIANNKLNGKGIWYYSNGGKCYEGDFRENLRHGRGKSFNENGTLQYDGEWRHDQMNGQGRLFKPVNLKHATKDVREYILKHGYNDENLSFARQFDLYSIGENV